MLRSTIIVALLALGVLVTVQGARVRLHPDGSTTNEDPSKKYMKSLEKPADEKSAQNCLSPADVLHENCKEFWVEWTEWTACSKTCGGGTRSRKGENYCYCTSWNHGTVRCTNMNDEEKVEGCEQWCVYGTWDSIREQCSCDDGHYGYCCEMFQKDNQDLVDKFRKAQGNVKATDVPGNGIVAPPNEPKHAQPMLMNVAVNDVKEEGADVKHSDQGNMGSTSVLVAGCFAGFAALVAAVVLAVYFKTRQRKPLEPLTVNNPTFKS